MLVQLSWTLLSIVFFYFLIKCRWYSFNGIKENSIRFYASAHLMDIFVRLGQIYHNMWCYKVKWPQFVWRSALPRTLCRCCLTLCILQGASEDAPAKKEQVDKGNENYQKVKEVRPFSQAFSWFSLLDLLHQTPLNQAIWVGHAFYFNLLLLLSSFILAVGASCGAVVYGFTSGGFIAQNNV